MAQILIRNINENDRVTLQILAESHGRSMEEEVRQIIKTALEKKRSGLGSQMASYFQGISPTDFEIPTNGWGNIQNPFEE